MFYRLHCGYQNYDWGKLGSSSLVAQFAAANDGVQIDENEPYAELWMGSHPKVPSKTVGHNADGSDLREICAKHPEALGDKVAKEFGEGELPYLFKVLSIRKALSIQAHPDKSLGKELFARDPKNYPDDNHKPEMAIALTDFEGFCGFRPLNEISTFLHEVTEFTELVGTDMIAVFDKLEKKEPKEALKAVFTAVMKAPEARVAELSTRLAARAAEEKGNFVGGAALAELLVRVNEQFPEDVGLFCGGLMLNYVTLKKGEAMFLRAKDPHAYISGDIIECMAASDNVVRAGFTPKFKDVPTLVNMLTYDSAPVEEQKMKPTAFKQISGGEAKCFDPPIDEFAVVQVTSEVGKTTQSEALTAATVFIVTEGSGVIKADNDEFSYERGYVFFAGAGTPFEIEAKEKTVSYHAVAEI